MSDEEYKFSRSEVSNLTGLTQSQLRTLEDTNVIKIQKKPIKYNSDQLIYAGLFGVIRFHFSWEVSLRYLKKYIGSYTKNFKSYNSHPEVVSIYPNFGKELLLTKYTRENDPELILKKGVLLEVSIGQSVPEMLLPQEEIVVDGEVKYYIEPAICDRTYKIYINNLIKYFNIKSQLNASNRFKQRSELLE